MIQHHLSDDQLLAYSAGVSTQDTAVLVACHLTLCPACRARLRRLDQVHAVLADGPEAPVQVEALLQGVLDQLDQPAPPTPPRVDADGVLPAALAAHVGDFSSLVWTRVFPGVEQITLDLQTEGLPARMFRLAPGQQVPPHGHKDTETTLVFTGGFTDEGGHFLRGDVCVRDHTVTHRQWIDPGEPCVVLVLADHPLIPRSVRGWVASKLRPF